MKKIILATAVSLLASASYSDEMYLGFAYSVVDSELSIGGLSADSKPGAINLILGMEFSENFAVEGMLGFGARDGEVEFQGSGTGLDFGVETVFGASLVGKLPLGESFGIYGKLGVAQISYDDSDGDSADATGVSYGVGGAFYLNEKMTFNLEYLQLPDGEYDDFNIDVEASALQFGMTFKI